MILLGYKCLVRHGLVLTRLHVLVDIQDVHGQHVAVFEMRLHAIMNEVTVAGIQVVVLVLVLVTVQAHLLLFDTGLNFKITLLYYFYDNPNNPRKLRTRSS